MAFLAHALYHVNMNRRIASLLSQHARTPMRFLTLIQGAIFFLSTAPLAFGQDAALPPIRKVEIRDRIFYINDKPFFPLMGWLQDAKNFPLLKECGMNATAGYWSGSGGAGKINEY